MATAIGPWERWLFGRSRARGDVEGDFIIRKLVFVRTGFGLLTRNLRLAFIVGFVLPLSWR